LIRFFFFSHFFLLLLLLLCPFFPHNLIFTKWSGAGNRKLQNNKTKLPKGPGEENGAQGRAAAGNLRCALKNA